MRLPSRASSLLVLSVIGLTATLSEANEMHGVFGRLKHVTGGKEGEEAAEPEVKHHRRGLQTIVGAFEKVGTPAHTAYLQSVRKNGVDPVALFDASAKSEAMKKLLNNPEIQHRLLEEMPLLGAIPGFKAVTGRRLSNEATMAGFAEGLKSLLSLTKNMDKTVKDPLFMLNIVDEMQKSDDPEMKELFRLSSLNDVGAMQKLQNIAVDKAFPGVDMAHIRKVRDESNFDKLLKYPELKAFIDQDEEISKILRATTAPFTTYPKN